MGLLDDAIREHMELKRLRGADPSEVARQEHDALGPVVRERDGEGALAEEGESENEQLAGEDHGGAHGERVARSARERRGRPEDAALDEDDSSGPPHPARSPDFANVGQETAELDMRTVLEESSTSSEWDPRGRRHRSHGDPAGPAGAHAAKRGSQSRTCSRRRPTSSATRPSRSACGSSSSPPRDFDFDK